MAPLAVLLVCVPSVFVLVVLADRLLTRLGLVVWTALLAALTMLAVFSASRLGA